MRVSYYKSKRGNLGDDINSIIWPKLLPNNTDTTILGIGTILYPDSPHLQNLDSKVIFGSGVRKVGDLSNFKLKSNVDIQFVRGPLSSSILNGAPFITDPGLLIKDLIESKVEKKGGCYIPYFASEDLFSYEGNGLDVVSFKVNDSGDMIRVLNKLSTYKFIITESLHGAIFADALGIPWLKVNGFPEYYESKEVHYFKWDDYNLSVGRHSYHSVDFKVPYALRFKKIQGLIAALGIKMKLKLNEKDFRGIEMNYLDESLVDKKIVEMKKCIRNYEGV